MYTEAYVDESDPVQPLKYRLNYHNEIAIDIDAYTERTNTISPNQFIGINGESEEFYTLNPGYVNRYAYNGQQFIKDKYKLSSSYDVVRQFDSYTPISTSSRRSLKSPSTINPRRNLNEASSKSLMSPLYFTFYILS